ncbi:MAG: hypothetical protein VX265_02675 [Myxococcota bacterium]|nr:hypothetical protein [Myxococcota bacterium]
MRSKVPSALPILAFAFACSSGAGPAEDDDAGEVALRALSDWPDFPAERDFAVLLPLQEVPVVPAGTRLPGGDAALPKAWLEAVADAYEPTIVEDGFGEENGYRDWRLVSVRVSPCSPVARSPALAPASVCWPVVRLVWQPVVDFMRRGGVQIDAWADDRAIHAIYPVQPRDSTGRRVDSTALQRVRSSLDAGQPYSALSASAQAAFEYSRDRTTAWLLGALLDLRDPSLPVGSWDGIDDRPELTGTEGQQAAFAARLSGFLSQTATARDLRELTAFSLPAGRHPSVDDAWVFVQFISDGNGLERKSLEVFSRSSGELLLDYGPDQDAGQTRESPAVEAALDADPDGELHDTVVRSSSSVNDIADLIADPAQVFVPNTTCATCHRLNGLRFDFHSLSHFEDNAHTVSPRVEADVAWERAWTDAWLSGSSSTGGRDSSGAAHEGGTGDGTSTGGDADSRGEPNDTIEAATPVRLPLDARFEVTAGDQDLYALDLPSEQLVTVSIAFSHEAGDLDLALVDSDGNTLAESTSTEDEETLSRVLPAGRTLIWVYGFDDATGIYRLRID